MMSDEHMFALAMIEKWGLYHEGKHPVEIVTRAFHLAKLAFQHIEDSKKSE